MALTGFSFAFCGISDMRKDTRFQPEGKNVAAKASQSVGIRFPVEIIEALQAVPGGRQEYIRKVVLDALKADGLI